MRTFESRTTYLHLDPEDGEKEPISMELHGLKRPIKIQPTSVTVKWERTTKGGPHWQCIDITLYGNRIHPTCKESVAMHYLGWGATIEEEMPAWVAELVATTVPV